MSSIFFILYFAIIVMKSESARILAFYPTPSISHQQVFRPLMQELVRRGHEVVVLTTDPAFTKQTAPANLTEIDLHDISYSVLKKFTLSKTNTVINQIEIVLKAFAEIVQVQFKSAEVQKVVNNNSKSFDLLFVEQCIQPALVFSHLFNVPVIQFSSFGGMYGSFEMIGASAHPKLYPYYTKTKLYNLTFWEDVLHFYSDNMVNKLHNKYEIVHNKMLRKIFGPTIPQLEKLKQNVQMLFFNIHPLLDFNRPVPRNVIYLWGIHDKTTKELPEELKQYLDNSVNGVIYMSLGSNVKTSLLPYDKVKIFTKVFSQLPYNILLKWDGEQIVEFSKNVKHAKWFPQSDLLRHPNIKMFITQGGLQSTDEAIKAGIPLLFIPRHSDQWYNAEQCEFYKIGIKLEMETLSEYQFKNAIENIINILSYRQNIINLRAKLHDQMQTSLERAVYWTEHVLRHGQATHLQSPAAHIHWTEYYEVELALILLIVLIILFVTVTYTIYRIRLRLLYTTIKFKL